MNPLVRLAGGLCNALILSVPLLFFPNPGKVNISIMMVIFFGIQVGWTFGESGVSPHTDHGTPSESPWLTPVLSIFFLIISLVSVADFWGHPQGVFLAIQIPGLLLLILGIGFRLLALKTLGVYFLNNVELAHHHKLICSGVYKYLRHPSETGNILILTGTIAWFQSPSGLFIFLGIFIPLTLLRIHKEDKLLSFQFGAAFHDYRKITGGVLPLLFRRTRIHSPWTKNTVVLQILHDQNRGPFFL